MTLTALRRRASLFADHEPAPVPRQRCTDCDGLTPDEVIVKNWPLVNGFVKTYGHKFRVLGRDDELKGILTIELVDAIRGGSYDPMKSKLSTWLYRCFSNRLSSLARDKGTEPSEMELDERRPFAWREQECREPSRAVRCRYLQCLRRLSPRRRRLVKAAMMVGTSLSELAASEGKQVLAIVRECQTATALMRSAELVESVD